MITKNPQSVIGAALKSDREALKVNEVLKRTLRSNGNVLKGDKHVGAKGWRRGAKERRRGVQGQWDRR